MTTLPIMIHNHEWSLTVDNYNKQDKLNKFMRIVSTSKAENKKETEYVDSMEAYNYPIFGIMYHPEHQLYRESNPKYRA